MQEKLKADLAIYLENMEPELMNITRLFGIPDEVWTAEQRRFAWRMDVADAAYKCSVFDTQTGQQAEMRDDIPRSEGDGRLDDLHCKRTARRLCKNTLYRLCRGVTGV